MALTPEDVVNKRFQPTKFREGYDQDEVDDFLDEIVVELRRLNHVADGAQQKEKIIAEAQIEASSLVNDAQEKSRKILGALEQQRSVLERKVEQLRGFERDYRSRLKAYIEGQLRDLDARGSVAAPEVGEATADV